MSACCAFFTAAPVEPNLMIGSAIGVAPPFLTIRVFDDNIVVR
jgi:hypothetical protein